MYVDYRIVTSKYMRYYFGLNFKLDEVMLAPLPLALERELHFLYLSLLEIRKS